MTSNVQKFQLTQGGKNYILTTLIEGNFVKLICVNSDVPNSPNYYGNFSLAQLQQISKKFNSMSSIYQAQDFLNQSIENQKVSVQQQGNIINITLYFEKEGHVENIVTKIDYNPQAIDYNTIPIEYNTVQEQSQYAEYPTITNINTTETVENTVNYLPTTTNYDFTQDTGFITTNTDNQTYENYNYGTNYENNYQTYENVNIDTNINTNTNYDYNLNEIVETKQNQINTYEAAIQTPEMETLTLPLNLMPQEKKIDENKYLSEIARLKNQIKILEEEITILKTKTVEKTVVKTVDNSNEILLLKQEIQRLKNIQINFENYRRQKEEEIERLKFQIQELLKTRARLEEIIEELKIKISQFTTVSNDKQTLTIQDTRLEIVKGDIIQSANELELLTRKICKDYNKITLNLLYKATVDSDKAAVFHNKCDEASNTLVLIQSTNGKRFGGYTSCSWEGESIEKKDEDAFVFSLDKMQIYNIISGEEAIGCYPKYGPVFLGCQIRIFDEFFKNGGSTFEKGMNYETEEDFELTGGLKNFQVKEIEVYGVELE